MTYTRLAIFCFYALLATLVFSLPAFIFDPNIETIFHISIWSIVYFIFFCFLALYFGKTVAKSKDLNAINKLFMVLVFLKLATALAVFLIFVKFYQPEGRWFVMPFIGAYITFTIVEVISLKSLSKMKSQDEK
ncbi:MAG: hypothetical protein EA362_07420 [Saprospirales bacterium]|nr:MAG: hypothetical protein EA362_07420 [Saprospirales bacterium]